MPRQIGGHFLVEEMETLRLFECQTTRRLPFEGIEETLELSPGGALTRDKPWQIDDHRSALSLLVRNSLRK